MSVAPLPRPIVEERIIPVARGLSPLEASKLAGILLSAGLHVIEVTVEREGGIESLAAVRGRGLVIGAGTVTSISQAGDSIAAGASFLVCPYFDPALVEWATRREIPIIAGALTPTEVHSAWETGSAAVKVFPAAMGGPGLIRALRAPFPQIPLIPTGGVTADNAADYLRAGAVAVGVGDWLTGSDEPDLIAERAAALIAAIGVV